VGELWGGDCGFGEIARNRGVGAGRDFISHVIGGHLSEFIVNKHLRGSRLGVVISSKSSLGEELGFDSDVVKYAGLNYSSELVVRLPLFARTDLTNCHSRSLTVAIGRDRNLFGVSLNPGQGAVSRTILRVKDRLSRDAESVTETGLR
jgi:hypothetical protein